MKTTISIIALFSFFTFGNPLTSKVLADDENGQIDYQVIAIKDKDSQDRLEKVFKNIPRVFDLYEPAGVTATNKTITEDREAVVLEFDLSYLLLKSHFVGRATIDDKAKPVCKAETGQKFVSYYQFYIDLSESGSVISNNVSALLSDVCLYSVGTGFQLTLTSFKKTGPATSILTEGTVVSLMAKQPKALFKAMMQVFQEEK